MPTFLIELSEAQLTAALGYIHTRAAHMPPPALDALQAVAAQLEGQPYRRPTHWRDWVGHQSHARHVDQIEGRHP